VDQPVICIKFVVSKRQHFDNSLSGKELAQGFMQMIKNVHSFS